MNINFKKMKNKKKKLKKKFELYMLPLSKFLRDTEDEHFNEDYYKEYDDYFEKEIEHFTQLLQYDDEDDDEFFLKTLAQ